MKQRNHGSIEQFGAVVWHVTSDRAVLLLIRAGRFRNLEHMIVTLSALNERSTNALICLAGITET